MSLWLKLVNRLNEMHLIHRSRGKNKTSLSFSAWRSGLRHQREKSIILHSIPKPVQHSVSWVKAKQRLLKEGPCKTVPSMIYISSSQHFLKVAIYQSDWYWENNYLDFSEVIVHLLKMNVNTNLCRPDISLKGRDLGSSVDKWSLSPFIVRPMGLQLLSVVISPVFRCKGASLVAQMVKCLPAMQKT